MKKISLLFSYIFIFLVSCIEPYIPPVVNAKGLLVVNGHAYVDFKTCDILLSRSQAVNSKEPAQPELAAKVTLEDNFNQSFSLNEIEDGHYFASNLNLEYGKNYRLKIITSDGKQYISTFVEALKAPVIEKINFQPDRLNEQNKVQNWKINIDAKDDNITNKYYRINYVETWEYRAFFQSSMFYFNEGSVIEYKFRNNPNEIYKCWKSDSSNKILTYSTENLTQNFISKFQIQDVEVSSKKFNNYYSILAKITAITKDEYLYWEDLKKNSQSTGSIFDPQPSKITGNFVNLNDKNDPVLGFFSPYSISQKRETKSNLDLKDTPPVRIFDSDCGESTIATDGGGQATRDGFLILRENRDRTGVLQGYFVATQSCADCRLIAPKGTNTKPSFMP